MINKFKFPKRISFRTRLFIVMIGMLVIAGLMILGTTIQYESQRKIIIWVALQEKKFR